MKNKNDNPWILLVGVIIILSALFTIVNQRKQNTLEVYNDSDVLTTEEVNTKKTVIDTITYENTEYGFKVSIPKEWDKVIKDGYDTYIHPASATSIQIQVTPYDASINMIEAETVSTNLVEEGYTFINFSKLTSSSYEVLYQKTQQSTYDYIEDVFWTRNGIVKLICIVNDTNYEKMYSFISNTINSFAWTTEDIIPENYAIYYSEFADYEFAVPINWNFGISNNTYVAINPDDTVQMTVTATAYDTTLENLTATDITNLFKNGKSNFMLKEFSTSITNAQVKFTYNNGTPATNLTYLFSNGIYLYIIQFDYFDDYFDDAQSTLCINFFREFCTKKLIEESDAVEKDTQSSQTETSKK